MYCNLAMSLCQQKFFNIIWTCEQEYCGFLIKKFVPRIVTQIVLTIMYHKCIVPVLLFMRKGPDISGVHTTILHHLHKMRTN